MKKILITFGMLLAFFTSHSLLTTADPFFRELAPSRGHYKQIETLSRAATKDDDHRKFVTPQEDISRRLSLKPNYLTNVKVDDFHIPDVPANSSEMTKADIEYLLALQKRRTAEEVRSSLYMANVYYNLRVQPGDTTYGRFRRNIFHIGRSIGTWFHPDDLPVTADVMAKVWKDASYFIWSLKFKYSRIRPYVIDPRIKNLEDTDWAAYPSGHAANSYINAYIYMELAPEFTDVFVKDAYDMAHSREILGVHFPSDSEASRIFARQFVNMLFENNAFREDFAKMKAEWKENAREKVR